MKEKIHPTRMEFLLLKKRRKTALYGHKLLKEKRDSLMQEFLKTIKEVKELREVIGDDLQEALRQFVIASSHIRPERLEEFFIIPSSKIEVKVVARNLMNVNLPSFEFKKEGDFLNYSLAWSCQELDDSMSTISQLLENFLRLAQLENAAYLLSFEIEKTRRRVNALEYVLIPSISKNIKYISQKLEEQEREAKIGFIKMKEKIS